jgi:hypothetical protein
LVCSHPSTPVAFNPDSRRENHPDLLDYTNEGHATSRRADPQHSAWAREDWTSCFQRPAVTDEAKAACYGRPSLLDIASGSSGRAACRRRFRIGLLPAAYADKSSMTREEDAQTRSQAVTVYRPAPCFANLEVPGLSSVAFRSTEQRALPGHAAKQPLTANLAHDPGQ